MTIKKLQWIESSVFFIGWTAVMLLGADFPPPGGFVWVLFGIALLDALQWFYLGWLLKAITHRKTFMLNLALFLSAGLLTALILTAVNGEFASGIMIWFVIISIVAAVYGIIFWSVNMWIARKKEL